MKITVINGNMRRGSTWHCADAVIQALSKSVTTEVTEFFLPKDMPHFCNGCFSCIMNGESTCPHAGEVAPIVEAMMTADVIILTSPVYGMDVSGQMKALLDHLCYLWMSHRPDKRMFGKIGVIVSTTAGAGLGHTVKTMKNSLSFWGIPKIYTLKMPVSASKWSDVKAGKQARIHKIAASLAARIAPAVKGNKKPRGPLFRSIFFAMMRGMMNKNDWNLTDRNHWEREGWLSGARPF